MKQVFELLWFLVTWFALVTIVCAIVFGVYVYRRADEDIRSYVEKALADQHPDLRVAVREARILERQGVEIVGVSLGKPDADGNHQELLYIDSISIRCQATLQALIDRELDIRQVTFHRPILHTVADPQGNWNLEPLIQPVLGLSRTPPIIKIDNGKIEVIDMRRAPVSTYMLRDLQFTLTPVPTSDQQVALRPMDPYEFLVDGTLTGDHLQHTSIVGSVAPHNGNWEFHGKVPRIDITPALVDSLPWEIAQHLSALPSLRAGGSLEFDVRHQTGNAIPIEFSVVGQVADGRVVDRRMPYPLTDLQASIVCNNQQLVVENLKARYGTATIQLSLRRIGTSTTNPLQISGSVTALPIDSHFSAFLSDHGKQTWNRYRPEGIIDAEFSLANVNGNWQPHLRVKCRDLSLMWKEFPYPIHHAVGPVTLQGKDLEFNLRGMASEQPVRIWGHVQNPGQHWAGRISAKTETYLPLDEKLIGALKPSQQNAIRLFHPQGSVRIDATYERFNPDLPINKQMTVDLVDCSVRHDRFPYALHRVRGNLEMRDGAWKFTNLEGFNDSAHVTCRGHSTRDPRGGNQFVMEFRARNIPLDDDLRFALKPDAQNLWQRLRPSGIVDELLANFQFHSRTHQQQLRFELREETLPEHTIDQSVNLQPVAFPYLIEDITGSVNYANHQFQWEELRGRHGAVKFTTKGSAQCHKDGGWGMNLNRVTADNLSIDDDLISALPMKHQSQVAGLHWNGAMNVLGAVTLQGHLQQPGYWQFGWNLALDVGQASIGRPDMHTGRPPIINHVAGTIHLAGQAEPDRFHSRGEVDIDSAMVRDVQLTQVRGPIWIDSQQLLLGRWAEEATTNRPPRQLVARTMGGIVQGDGQLAMSGPELFHVRMNVVDIEANQIMRHTTRQASAVKGLVRGNVELTGTRSSLHTMQGGGTMQLRDSNLYELPSFLTLLHTLRSGSVDRTAFTQSDVAFRVKGQDILFDRIDLVGDGLTLKGVGTLSEDRQVDLDFYTIMGRENEYLPAIRPLLGMASQRFLQIHVNGHMQNPRMTRVVLPGLNATLTQLFPDAAVTPATAGAKSESGSLRR